MTANEQRQAVKEAYDTILGRNLYSKTLRDYCFTEAQDGNYYSDSSSSICLSYEQAGLGFGDFDEVGLYQTDKLVDVPVIIKHGVVKNPWILRVGDILLFAGNDINRGYVNYCCNVEMVYSMEDTIQLCGHNSGHPSLTELDKYCRSRYYHSTATVLGNCGLLKVRRFIVE